MNNFIGMNIVIIDDETSVLDVYKLYINKHFPSVKCHIFSKVNKNFFETVNNIDVSIFIVDVVLGECDGKTLCEKLCKTHPYSIFLFVSGYDQDINIFSKLNCNCICDFAPKIIGTKSLMNRINVLLNVARTRKLMKEKLKKNEKRFQSLIENSTDITLILDADMKISYTSPSTERFLGYDQSDLIGKSCSDFIVKDDIKKVQEALSEIEKSPGSSNIMLNIGIKSRNGEILNIDSRATSMLTDSSVNGIVLNCRETTELKKIERSIWHIFNYMNFYVVLLDSDMNILLINYFAATSLGYSNEFEPLGLNWLQFIPDEEKSIVKQVHDEVKNDEQVFREYVNNIITKTKEKIPIRWFSTILNQGIKGTFSFGVPISENSSTVESVRAYWINIIQQDKSAIKAMRDMLNSKSKGTNECSEIQ